MAGVRGTAVVVISIICMVRGKVGVGIALLAADIIGGIIFYFIGLANLVALMGAGAVLGGGM